MYMLEYVVRVVVLIIVVLEHGGSGTSPDAAFRVNHLSHGITHRKTLQAQRLTASQLLCTLFSTKISMMWEEGKSGT
jgi:hypothetical protein